MNSILNFKLYDPVTRQWMEDDNDVWKSCHSPLQLCPDSEVEKDEQDRDIEELSNLKKSSSAIKTFGNITYAQFPQTGDIKWQLSQNKKSDI